MNELAEENQLILEEQQRIREEKERERAIAIERGDLHKLQETMGGGGGGRGRGRGSLSNLPAWMTKELPSESQLSEPGQFDDHDSTILNGENYAKKQKIDCSE